MRRSGRGWFCSLLVALTLVATEPAQVASWTLHAASEPFMVALETSRWRLVHVPHPGSGASVPALLQVADVGGSDIGFVGMMIRCAEKDDRAKLGGLVTLFVLAEPLSPRATPLVTLHAGKEPLTLTGQVIGTGAGVIVPLDIRAQILNSWRDADTLDVAIKTENLALKGLVHLRGLMQGLDQLAAQCLVE